jgi:hypothetical protein
MTDEEWFGQRKEDAKDTYEEHRRARRDPWECRIDESRKRNDGRLRYYFDKHPIDVDKAIQDRANG